MTKKEGIKNFMLKLEKDGLISRSEYSKIIANFDNANLMETYYKARKNIGNSMAQQSFVNMGNLGTMRKKTTNRKKTVLESFRKLTNRNPGLMDMFSGDKKKKTIKKKSHEMDQDQIIEEHDKESESNINKDINSFNLSLSNNNSLQETEKK